MSLRNVIVISRRMEVQELAQQAAENVFAADDIAEALDAAKRVMPDLILFDHRYIQDDIARFVGGLHHRYVRDAA